MHLPENYLYIVQNQGRKFDEYDVYGGAFLFLFDWWVLLPPVISHWVFIITLLCCNTSYETIPLVSSNTGGRPTSNRTCRHGNHFLDKESWGSIFKSSHCNSFEDQAHVEGILPKGPHPSCLRMADRALLAGYPRCMHDLQMNNSDLTKIKGHQDSNFLATNSLGHRNAENVILQGKLSEKLATTQIAKFIGPTWGPPRSCRPQMGPMLGPWTLLSGKQWPPGDVLCPALWDRTDDSGHNYLRKLTVAVVIFCGCLRGNMSLIFKWKCNIWSFNVKMINLNPNILQGIIIISW